MHDVIARLQKHLETPPKIGQNVYIASSATVIGDVQLGDCSSIWHQATLRGDIDRIVVGHHSNIQDNAVVHLADDLPCLIGHYVTVGHSAILHACTVGDETLIGMGAIVLDGAVVGNQCLVGAGTLITPGTIIPDGSLVLGRPGKVIRPLSEPERLGLKLWADKYVANAAYCLDRGIQVGAPLGLPPRS